jgi:alanine racemase
MKSRRVWAEIDLDAITQNLRHVRRLAGETKGVMAIIKANAYGHGAVPIAWHLAGQGVNALGVGDSQEAIELRRAGISIPIVILGAVVHGELGDVVADDIAVTVHSTSAARRAALSRSPGSSRRRTTSRSKASARTSRRPPTPSRSNRSSGSRR